MWLEYKITFKDNPPSPESILEEIKNVTGLSDVSYRKHEPKDPDSFLIENGKIFGIERVRRYLDAPEKIFRVSIVHPFFEIPSIAMRYDKSENQITLWTTDARIGYLLEASIVSLENLGGEPDYNVNPLARQKWEQVKDVYQDKSLIDWPEDI